MLRRSLLGLVLLLAAAGGAEDFTNPILPGFHADPSIVRVGDDYYLAHSSFEYFPGVPIMHSRDLVNWRLIGHALTRKSQLDLDSIYSSGGIFAPTLRYHDGTFYMVTTLVGTGRGNFYVTAKNPAGPWSEPVWLDKEGIDPSLFFDDDGTVYYTRQVDGARGYSGQQVLNLTSGALEGERRELWRGTGGVWPEGPHLYKVRGKYYLMISEGGTSYDHALTVARSDSPWGPFEPNPANPILSHKTLPDHPFQATGHGDLVETPSGWWVVFLGFRPQGGRFHHLGRETFLAPVTWENGWPVVNGGKPIPARSSRPELKAEPFAGDSDRDEFDREKLSLAWSHLRNPEASNYSLSARRGWLRLIGAPTSLGDVASPTFIGRPQTSLGGTAVMRLSFDPKAENEEAGLVLRGNERNHLDVVVTLRGGRRQVGLRRVLDGETSLVAFHDVPQGDIELGVDADPLSYEFFFRPAKGRRTSLGRARTRDLSTETLTAQKGAHFNFTGVFWGMFATGNGKRSGAPADVDWFEFRARGSAPSPLMPPDVGSGRVSPPGTR